MHALSDMEIKERLKDLPNWKFSNDCLIKKFAFKNHLATLAFLNAVAFYSEKIGHHPNVNYCYNEATLRYQTHDAQNKVTEKDLQAALYVNSLVDHL